MRLIIKWNLESKYVVIINTNTMWNAGWLSQAHDRFQPLPQTMHFLCTLRRDWGAAMATK